MRTIKLFAILMVLGFTGCVTIDYVDFKPIYFIVNHSHATVDFVYALQPGITEDSNQKDTIEIKQNDTIVLTIYGNSLDKWRRPAGTFSAMKFISKSGEVLLNLNTINNEDWLEKNIEEGPEASMWAYGWLYEFKEE